MNGPRAGEPPARRELAWVAGACAVSIALGILFVFVRAPHPWGWQGFDHYDDLGRALARGESYPTLDRVWGYPFFLAVCYRLFGERPWPALLLQVLLNGAIPALVYAGIRAHVTPRVAIVAALLIGGCSFNTVYASTQASDALCTVFTVGGVVLLTRAVGLRSTSLVVLAGAALGVAAQLRPNLLLLPLALAAVMLWRRMPLVAVALLCVAAAAIDVPWIVRNARVSGKFIPTTTRGGVQLWYGTVQVPPYFANWTLNPSRTFESTFFDYSPPGAGEMRVAAARKECAAAPLERVVLFYRTDRGAFHRVESSRREADRLMFSIPRPPSRSAVHYYFDAEWRTGSEPAFHQTTPLAGAAAPLVQFVAVDDLHDLDQDSELLDAYDVIKLLRHHAWREPFAYRDRLDLDRDGAITTRDIDAAISTLARPSAWIDLAPSADHVLQSIDVRSWSVVATMKDGSTVSVPYEWSGAITDVTIVGPIASDMMRSRRSLDRLYDRSTTASSQPGATPCFELLAAVDDDFFIREPKIDARYQTLAWANIKHTPVAFATACARRFFELFIVSGPGDAADGPPQASGSSRLYRIARVVTLILFGLTLAGLWIAWRRRWTLTMFWVPIAYIPLTLCYMTTNMRYTVAVQPFQFVFIAIALDALWTAATRRPHSSARASA